jgi:Glycosyl transferase family 2
MSDQNISSAAIPESGAAINLQQPFDVAVVIPTILRPHLRRALESVYSQDLQGRIQVLIGIDKALGSREMLNELISAAPPHVHVTVIDPGYSTSMRHGGVHSCFYAGAMRTVLSFLANSRYVAYLDDDDWFAPDHLSSMLTAIEGHDWAWSQRWYSHPITAQGICIDAWESMGPGQGVYAHCGGFVAPSCLMLDKISCAMLLPLWSNSPFAYGDGEDRLVLDMLIQTGLKGAHNNKASSFYTLDPRDGNHGHRMRWMREQGALQSEDAYPASDRLIGRHSLLPVKVTAAA